MRDDLVVQASGSDATPVAGTRYVVVETEGGVIQAVTADPGVEVVVVDLDELELEEGADSAAIEEVFSALLGVPDRSDAQVHARFLAESIVSALRSRGDSDRAFLAGRLAERFAAAAVA
jgi:hypothetical protein